MGMRSGVGLRWLLPAVAVFWAWAAFAEVPTPESGARQVQEHKAAAYREVLTAFDAAMQSASGDASIAVARCRFIGQFTDDEYGEWIESAPDDFESCRQSLDSRWAREPVAQLFALEQLWGEEAAKQGEKLLIKADGWPAPLRRELLTKVSEAQEQQGKSARAGELAVMAVRLGEPSRAAAAVNYLASRQRYAEATRLLAEAPPAVQAWHARQRIEATFALPDRMAGLKELRRYDGSDLSIDAAVAARAYLRAGDVEGARKLLEGKPGVTASTQQARFDVALAADDIGAAARLVDLTDTDDFSANLTRFATLLMRSPQALVSAPSMLVGASISLVMLIAFAMVPGLLFVPVHYRSLIRRAKGAPAVALFDGVGLRKAWYAAAIVLCVPLVVGMMVEPSATTMILGGETVPEAAALFRVMLWGTVAGLLCVIPALRGVDLQRLIGDRAALRASWRVLFAWVCLVGVGVVLALWHSHTGGAGETMQTKAMSALATSGRDAYGPVLTLFLVAILVPVFEELIYRGLILGGLSRHISFGWANVFQSALFALSHDDPPRLPFYFAMGLLSGWLVKRTGALGPAIALHVLNNAIVFSLKML